MVLKAFYAFLFALCAYLGFQVYDLYSARQSLTNIPEQYTIGSEDYDLTVVKFMNYSCIYCQQAHPIIMEAITLDANVRLAPRPLLSSDPDGSAAAIIFYAAANQGKAAQAHNYLMQNGQNLTRERLTEIAEALELDVDQFVSDIDSKDTHNKAIANMRALARLGGTGVPTFFIGPNIMYMAQERMPTAQDFLNIFEEARASR
ncbi:MAG: DsbA family protein [Alphaproteobacteria bacterium]